MKNCFLAISKIVDISIMVKDPSEILAELEKIQKRFIWPAKPKIKTETMSSNFKDGSLKNADTEKKITSIQCS